MDLSSKRKRLNAVTGHCIATTLMLEAEGKNPLTIDSKEPTMTFADYALNENRYRMLKISNPDMAEELMKPNLKRMLISPGRCLKAWAKALEAE